MENSSLINLKILAFYQNQQVLRNDDAEKFFHINGSLKFPEISELLLGKCNRAEIIEDLETFEYVDCLRCYKTLLPVFLHCSEVVGTSKTVLEELYLDWLGSNWDYMRKCFDVKAAATATVERVLLLTAMLENALGNVFYTHSKGRTPPHLLKDLLSTCELRDVFGVKAILFLKILLGTPKSINLRNIVWHGFPQPNELPAYYVAVLLLTVHTLGILLETQQFDLQQRPQIQNFTNCLLKLEQHFQMHSLTDGTQQILSACQWLGSQHKIYWQQLLQYYSNQQYCSFVILILPQLELLLRLIYGSANDYDITAKLDEYYITMDTILEVDVPAGTEAAVKRNKLLLGEANISMGTLHCMYDLFVAPYGPRLRDKVSHGEVSMAAINNVSVCRVLLHFALNLLTSNEQRFPLTHYESQFHLNALTKLALRQAGIDLHNFTTQHFKHEMQLKKITFTIVDLSSSQGRVNIFQRPKKEPEFMNLTLKIVQLIVQTCSNYDTSLQARLTLLEQRELHTKRRRTLDKLLQALPEICNVLYAIIKCLELTFLKLQTEMENAFSEPLNQEKLLRFLKHVLKISENLCKYSNKDSNEWIKALELCQKFNEIYERIFPWKDIMYNLRRARTSTQTINTDDKSE